MSDSAPSNDRTGWWQRRRARRRRIREIRQTAEIAENAGAAAGQLGGLIAQQRRRGHVATARAVWIFALLFVFLLAGLAYYVAVPLWLQWQASSRSVYEARANLLDNQLTEMDAARNSAWGEIIGALAFQGNAVDSQVADALFELRGLGDGMTLIAVGRNGVITRSTDGGKTWAARDSQVKFNLTDVRYLGDGATLVAVGRNGAITRSTDGGETWEARDSEVGVHIHDLSILGDGTVLVAVGGNGAITRSTDGGKTWEARDSQVKEALTDVRVLGDGTTLVAVGEGGAVTRSIDGGTTWTARESQVEDGLHDLRVLGDGTTLVAVGWDGAITRSIDGGKTWEARESQVEDRLDDVRVLGDGTTLVAVGWYGAITRSIDGGKTWEARDPQVNETFNHVRVLGDGTTLVAAGLNGAVTRSINGGQTWVAQVSQARGHFFDLHVLGDGTTLVAVGERGQAIVFDDRYANSLQTLVIRSGSVGDDEMRSALAELPVFISAGPVVSPLVVEFERTIEDRPSLVSQRDSARAQADEIRAGGFSLSQRRQDFAQFMEACRGVNGATEACTDAYVELRRAETQSVWEILAERAPQAILLLFLLATLAGLYRYNMRLAGFHHSRADALELFPKSGGTPATLAALSEALAADKVEFGRGSTPSDQAVEIAKAIVSRRST